jgi:hypothetical protein
MKIRNAGLLQAHGHQLYNTAMKKRKGKKRTKFSRKMNLNTNQRPLRPQPRPIRPPPPQDQQHYRPAPYTFTNQYQQPNQFQHTQQPQYQQYNNTHQPHLIPQQQQQQHQQQQQQQQQPTTQKFQNNNHQQNTQFQQNNNFQQNMPGAEPDYSFGNRYVQDFQQSATGQLGTQLASSAFAQARDQVNQNVGKWINLAQLKFFFNVSTSYVYNKLILLIFPFRHQVFYCLF